MPVTQPMGAWIEQLALEGITGGCSLTSPPQYCPDAGVTRAQMAVFLLRAKYGAGYQPPPATGQTFVDVPVTHPFARWIEQLALEGVTGGCAISPARYCPDSSVTRGHMAIFLDPHLQPADVSGAPGDVDSPPLSASSRQPPWDLWPSGTGCATHEAKEARWADALGCLAGIGLLSRVRPHAKRLADAARDERRGSAHSRIPAIPRAGLTSPIRRPRRGRPCFGLRVALSGCPPGSVRCGSSDRSPRCSSDGVTRIGVFRENVERIGVDLYVRYKSAPIRSGRRPGRNTASPFLSRAADGSCTSCAGPAPLCAASPATRPTTRPSTWCSAPARYCHCT